MLVLHYDLVSAASAVAVLRLQRIADRGGSVLFSGIDPLGLDGGVPATLDQLDEYASFREAAAELGLSMRRPNWRPPTLRAHLVGELAERQGLGAAWRHTALRAYWEHGHDLADHDVLLELVGRAGADVEVARQVLDDPQRVLAARQQAAATVRRGVGGVPMLEVSGTLLSAHLDEDALTELAG